jgi:hypothetical protein
MLFRATEGRRRIVPPFDSRQHFEPPAHSLTPEGPECCNSVLILKESHHSPQKRERQGNNSSPRKPLCFIMISYTKPLAFIRIRLLLCQEVIQVSYGA